MPRIDYETRSYVFSHGHKPRGRGHWMFTINRDNGQQQLVSYSGTLTDCKAALRRDLRDDPSRWITVTVMP